LLACSFRDDLPPTVVIYGSPGRRHSAGASRYCHDVVFVTARAGNCWSQASASFWLMIVRVPIFLPRSRPDLSSSYALVRPWHILPRIARCSLLADWSGVCCSRSEILRLAFISLLTVIGWTVPANPLAFVRASTMRWTKMASTKMLSNYLISGSSACRSR
jgi:hypothetical protein